MITDQELLEAEMMAMLRRGKGIAKDWLILHVKDHVFHFIDHVHSGWLLCSYSGDGFIVYKLHQKRGTTSELISLIASYFIEEGIEL